MLMVSWKGGVRREEGGKNEFLSIRIKVTVVYNVMCTCFIKSERNYNGRSFFYNSEIEHCRIHVSDHK